jgi:hypothetical protein
MDLLFMAICMQGIKNNTKQFHIIVYVYNR